MISTKETLLISIILSAFLCGCSAGKEAEPVRIDQFPSPMVEYIRRHERIENKNVPGVSIVLKDTLSKPVGVYFTDRPNESGSMDLLIHFHGSSYVPKQAVYDSNHPLLLAVVNLGSGSSVYENAFEDQSTFPRLVEMIYQTASGRNAVKIKPVRIYLSSFSAGYRAVRAILRLLSGQVATLQILL